mgnify:CR=1 FL=1
MTCADMAEGQRVSKVLLEKKLVACVKFLPVGADFLWDGKVDHNDEVLLMMESREDLFDQIEAEIAKVHSYDTFGLQATPINKLSKDAETWLHESLT